ncbi:hypothetical protein CLAIMM_11329 [Cladophialophora immunda]|nr:hypothetical protein CLAIMM_11329 [Cladophialophora immunda]
MEETTDHVGEDVRPSAELVDGGEDTQPRGGDANSSLQSTATATETLKRHLNNTTASLRNAYHVMRGDRYSRKSAKRYVKETFSHAQRLHHVVDEFDHQLQQETELLLRDRKSMEEDWAYLNEIRMSTIKHTAWLEDGADPLSVLGNMEDPQDFGRLVEKRFHNLRAQIDILTTDLANLKKAHDELLCDNTGLKTRITQLEEDYDSESRACKDLVKVNETLEKNACESKMARDAAVRAEEHARDLLSKERADAVKVNETLVKVIDDHARERENFAQERDGFSLGRAECAELRSQLDAERQKTEALSRQVFDQNETLRAKDDSFAQLSADHAKLLEESQSTEVALANSDKERDDLRELLASLEETYRGTAGELQTTLLENFSLSDDSKQGQIRFNVLRRRVRQRSYDHIRLNTREIHLRATLEAQAEMLNQERARADNAERNAQQAADTLQETRMELEAQREQADQANAALAQREKEVEALRGQVDQANAALAQREKEVEALRGQVDQALADAAANAREAEAKREQVNKLDTALAEERRQRGAAQETSDQRTSELAEERRQGEAAQHKAEQYALNPQLHQVHMEGEGYASGLGEEWNQREAECREAQQAKADVEALQLKSDACGHKRGSLKGEFSSHEGATQRHWDAERIREPNDQLSPPGVSVSNVTLRPMVHSDARASGPLPSLDDIDIHPNKVFSSLIRQRSYQDQFPATMSPPQSSRLPETAGRVNNCAPSLPYFTPQTINSFAQAPPTPLSGGPLAPPPAVADDTAMAPTPETPVAVPQPAHRDRVDYYQSHSCHYERRI